MNDDNEAQPIGIDAVQIAEVTAVNHEVFVGYGIEEVYVEVDDGRRVAVAPLTPEEAEFMAKRLTEYARLSRSLNIHLLYANAMG